MIIDKPSSIFETYDDVPFTRLRDGDAISFANTILQNIYRGDNALPNGTIKGTMQSD